MFEESGDMPKLKRILKSILIFLIYVCMVDFYICGRFCFSEQKKHLLRCIICTHRQIYSESCYIKIIYFVFSIFLDFRKAFDSWNIKFFSQNYNIMDLEDPSFLLSNLIYQIENSTHLSMSVF